MGKRIVAQEECGRPRPDSRLRNYKNAKSDKNQPRLLQPEAGSR